MKLAWLFPGQGAQAVGMGRDVFDELEAAREVFERVDGALGEPLSELCFEGPAEALTLTANAQPAILATSMALLAALRQLYPDLPQPCCSAGHSLGEYSALTAAGALPVEQAAQLCRLRGTAMQRAVPAGVGAMAAIMKLDGAEVAELCGAAGEAFPGLVVSAANFNAPGQTVIAGHKEAVDHVLARVKERRARGVLLKVSAPFHCALMTPAREALAAELAGSCLTAPSFPVIANVDAQPKSRPAEIAEALLCQIDQPVRWSDTIGRMTAMGVTHALEIGPGKVLSGLARRTAKSLRVLAVNDRESIDKIGSFLATEN